LIGIRRRAQCDFFPRLDVVKLLPQQVGGMLLDENLLLEIDAVAHFHEFMGIARVTVLAGELASAVGVDRPRKRHAYAGATVEQRPNREREVFDFMPLAQRFPLRSETRDADKLGFGCREEGKCGHE